MFHTYVASLCSKCFICFRRMLYSIVLYFRGMSKESWVMAQMPGADKWGVLGSCRQGELVLILGPARAEREERVRGKEQQTRCFP
jgi:hypothetical protein